MELPSNGVGPFARKVSSTDRSRYGNNMAAQNVENNSSVLQGTSSNTNQSYYDILRHVQPVVVPYFLGNINIYEESCLYVSPAISYVFDVSNVEVNVNNGLALPILENIQRSQRSENEPPRVAIAPRRKKTKQRFCMLQSEVKKNLPKNKAFKFWDQKRERMKKEARKTIRKFEREIRRNNRRAAPIVTSVIQRERA